MSFAFPLMLACVAAATLLFAPTPPPAVAGGATAAVLLDLGEPHVPGDPPATAETFAAPEPRPDAPAGHAQAPDARPSVPVLLMPVEGVRVADVWPSFGDPRSGGRSHAGVDIMAPRGTPVRAAAVGTVWRAGESCNGGISVTVLGDDGTRYFYAHLDALAPGLEPRQRVGVDTVLGFVGNTGNAAATAPHLHFEVAPAVPGEGRSWTPVDPLPLLHDRQAD